VYRRVTEKTCWYQAPRLSGITGAMQRYRATIQDAGTRSCHAPDKESVIMQVLLPDLPHSTGTRRKFNAY